MSFDAILIVVFLFNMGGGDRKVVGFTTSCAISSHHHWSCDKFCWWLEGTGHWFSPAAGTAVSSTNKNDHSNIAEILLNVAWNTTTPNTIDYEKMDVKLYILLQTGSFSMCWQTVNIHFFSNTMTNNCMCTDNLLLITLLTRCIDWLTSYRSMKYKIIQSSWLAPVLRPKTSKTLFTPVNFSVFILIDKINFRPLN